MATEVSRMSPAQGKRVKAQSKVKFSSVQKVTTIPGAPQPYLSPKGGFYLLTKPICFWPVLDCHISNPLAQLQKLPIRMTILVM